ncbi:MAG: hypothetical protein J6M05_05580 [Cardiobacteriaceae bacterium]|nr:hypothetical protein [Cardiobacteriaceae bacterium]
MNQSFKRICSLCSLCFLTFTICANAEEMPKPPVWKTFQELKATELENNKYIGSKISKKDGKTTYFFDKRGKKIDKKVADGFYRVILGKTAEGNCVV